MTPDDLVELELIKRVKYRYMRAIDQKRWDDLAEVFTDDAVAEYSGGKYRYEGREAIVDFLRTNMGAETFHSAHRVHQPEIDLTSPTTAVGTWAMDDVVVMTDWDLTVQGAAFYEDEYRKVDGAWRISRTGYKRTYEELVPRASIAGIQLTASWWSTGGQSSLEVQ